jgi:hypothetical protein
MSQFLIDLANAHKTHEGFYPPGVRGFPQGSLSYRNNNPGNLRLTKSQKSLYGAVQGSGNFARFSSYAVGFQALMDDIEAKITGRSAHINYSKNPTFLDYIKVYAPTEDKNNPYGYCQTLIRMLPQYSLSPSTPLTAMAVMIREPVTRISKLLQAIGLARRNSAKTITSTPKKQSPSLRKL